MKQKKVLLVVMDGVGLSATGYGDAVKTAKTPTLDRLMQTEPWCAIKAHGTAVGLPTDDDMGNSEVGHNALGSGQIYAQGAKLVNESIANGKLYDSKTWNLLISNVTQHRSTLHFMGLLSDGNVHSNIRHLEAMIRKAKAEGVQRVRVHALLDGRDVPATSGLQYIRQIEAVFAELNDDQFDAAIASGGGRMQITMDRYRADWAMVERGWNTHVHGVGRRFQNAEEAYTTLREETGHLDQDLPGFVIQREGQPIGQILTNDSVIFFNFRGDRAIEISMAFEDETFPYFDRGQRPQVVYAGMLEYDGDLHIPSNYLVAPPEIEHTLTEFLIEHQVKEYACSETQKFGHVTYFWNGNRSGYVNVDWETYYEVPSDNVPFDERPWMKSAEIADAVIEAMQQDQYGFIRCNLANGDMVGHTGCYRSVEIAMEAVDLAISRMETVARQMGYTLIVTADHGNADDMYQKKPKDGSAPAPKTSHSLNPVPFIVVSDQPIHFKEGSFGLANVASTVVTLLGLTPPEIWEASMIDPL